MSRIQGEARLENVSAELFESEIRKAGSLDDVRVEIQDRENGAVVVASSGEKYAALHIPKRGAPLITAEEVAAIYAPALAEELQKALQVGRYDRTGKIVVCPKHWDEVMEYGARKIESAQGKTIMFLSEVEDCPICAAGGLNGILQPPAV